MIRGVFFDLDGTLFDTAPDILDAYRRVFEEAGFAFDPSLLKIGPTLEEALKIIRPEITPEETAAAVARFRVFYDGCGFAQTLPYPGIMEMLKALHGAGKRIFVATNKRLAPTERILEVRGVLPMLSGIYTPDSDPAQRRKKAENLRVAMASHGLAPEECVMVGDTNLDVEAGHAAGIAAIGVPWGYDEQGKLAAAKPEKIIGHPSELLNTLETL